MKEYVCPKCASTNLSVTVSTSARLIQQDDGDFQTEIDGDHEWDHTHTMWCNDCQACGMAAGFYVEPPKGTV
jgi:hypothetical protein